MLQKVSHLESTGSSFQIIRFRALGVRLCSEYLAIVRQSGNIVLNTFLMLQLWYSFNHDLSQNKSSLISTIAIYLL